MKQSDYLKETLKQVGEDSKITCQDCGQRDGVAHAIVDHEKNTVKVVCHDCFNDKYLDQLYGKAE